MPNDHSSLGIEARGLTKTFDRLAAVRDLNLQVAPGTLFGFLGPNGSGKSTTIKLLTGLLAPTAGEVRVAGQTVSLENIELRRVIGILPEDAALFHSLTIWEHLELSGPLYGLSRQETRARAIQLLRHLDLAVILLLVMAVYLVSLHYAGRSFEHRRHIIGERLS
jgi:ABC-type multidrug transport system ATPase subunit